MRYRSYKIDIVALTGLCLFSLIFAMNFVDFSAHPIEDAAILMRYAEHFADGHGIVWNIGEPLVDGATDFLFMIAVGLLYNTGLTLEFATRFIGFSSHILTVGIVYLTLRRVFDAPYLISLGTGLFLAVGPGFYYVVAYFGTTFFALSACASWLMALTIIQTEEDKKRSLLFALASLLTGLIRPEGVFLSGFMLLSIVFIKGLKNSRYTIIYYFAVFFLLGGSYLLWRWHYFGFPLPNPYYKKGDGAVYINSLKASYFNTFFLCLPLLPPFIAGLSFLKTFRKTIGYLIPIFAFASLFILLTNEMNIQSRFQYVLLPVGLMVWWPLTKSIRDRMKFPEWTDLNVQQTLFYSLLLIILSSGLIYYEYGTEHVRYYKDGKYVIAVMLSEYKYSNLTIATSEAGLLPLYSQLRSLDTWGLNDQWIAHHGGITAEYLKTFNPRVIMFHVYFSPIASSDRGDAWHEMTLLLKANAEDNGYILAASFGDNPYDTEYYFVRSDFPESAEIIRRIRETEYYSGMSGRKYTNYALGSGQ